MCVADVACLSGYGSVGRLLVVVVEGLSLKASDDDGKAWSSRCHHGYHIYHH